MNSTTQLARTWFEKALFFFWILQVLGVWLAAAVCCFAIDASMLKDTNGSTPTPSAGGGGGKVNVPESQVISMLTPVWLGQASFFIMLAGTNLSILLNLRYAVELKVEADDIRKGVVVLAMAAGKVSLYLCIYLSIYLYIHQVSTLAKCDSACTKAREFVCVCVCDKTYLQIVPLP